MNIREQYLPELELPTCHVREALQCLLHTILFIRSPGPVEPQDVPCEGFRGLTYTRIATTCINNKPCSIPFASLTNPSTLIDSSATNIVSSSDSTSTTPSLHKSTIQQPNSICDMDTRVDQAIDVFLRSLSQIGPELLSGCLTLSFLERRTTRQLFGFLSNEEKIIFEQWHIRVVVNNTPRPLFDDSTSILERQRLQDMSDGMLRAAMMKIIDLANHPDLDHIPPVLYDFEISCSKKMEDRDNMYSRVSNMPPLFVLDG